MAEYFTIPLFNYVVQREVKDWQERKAIHESRIEELRRDVTGLEFEYPDSSDNYVYRCGVIDDIKRSKKGDLLIVLRLLKEGPPKVNLSHSDNNIKSFRVDRIVSTINVTVFGYGELL